MKTFKEIKPYLDNTKDELKKWMVDNRDWLIFCDFIALNGLNNFRLVNDIMPLSKNFDMASVFVLFSLGLFSGVNLLRKRKSSQKKRK